MMTVCIHLVDTLLPYIMVTVYCAGAWWPASFLPYNMRHGVGFLSWIVEPDYSSSSNGNSLFTGGGDLVGQETRQQY